MSTKTPDENRLHGEPTNDYIRARIDHLVRAKSTSFRCFHPPHPESDEDDPKPLCHDPGARYSAKENSWHHTALVTFPPSHTEDRWCDNCKEMIEENHEQWIRLIRHVG